jgi:hypothetical protein
MKRPESTASVSPPIQPPAFGQILLTLQIGEISCCPLWLSCSSHLLREWSSTWGVRPVANSPQNAHTQPGHSTVGRPLGVRGQKGGCASCWWGRKVSPVTLAFSPECTSQSSLPVCTSPSYEPLSQVEVKGVRPSVVPV